MQKTINDVQTYADQLKTSAWLKRKTEILTRDNFVCTICLKDNFESRLEVHHIGYLQGKMAWEYPDYLLVTLCRDCHQSEHDGENIWKPEIIKAWIVKLAGKLTIKK